QTKDAVKVIAEAAQWLIRIQQSFWDPESLTEENLLKKSFPENFFVAYIHQEPAAAMILDWEDPLFWPDIPSGTSGFVHKLSVSRKYAGKGLPAKLIQY